MHASPLGFSAIRTPFRTGIAFVVVALALGCGGGGGGGNGGTTNPPPPSGAFILGASSTTLSITKNATASATGALTIAATRTGGFTGLISLQANGLPGGVTASFVPATLDQVSSTSLMTLTVVAAAAPGTYNFTIQGTSTGQTTQNLSVSLTIAAAPAQTGPFTLSISATSYLVYPTNQLTSNPIITITRNAGFTGGVTFSTSGLPATLVIAFSPSTTTANTTQTLVLNVGATPNGVYTATITGTSAQGNQTVTLQIHVMSASTGNIKWKWCTASLPRYFVAVRDGNGPWTRLMPALDSSYSFNINSGVGELAEVVIDSGGFRTTVYQFTAQEMAARAAAQCRLVQNVTTRTANGTFAGVPGFRVALAGMAWWFGSANGNGSFTMLNLPSGPLDVLGARDVDIVDPAAIAVDRFIIRRAQNPASGSTMPALDFGAAESFAPTTASWTFANTNGQSFGVSQMFTTVGGSTLHFNAIPSIDGSATTRTIYGVPLAQTQAGDLHQIIATVATIGPVPGGPNRATRQIIRYARTLAAPATLTFGPAMPNATVSTVAPGRLRAQGTLPVEYNTGVAFDITQTTTGRFFSLYATRGFMGSGLSTYDVQMPDLSAAIGWDTQFAIRTGIPTNWWVSGGTTLDLYDVRYLFNSTRSQWTGPLTGVLAPSDGATFYSARVIGNSTP